MRGHTEKETLQQNAFLALAAITWSSKEIQASAREAEVDRCCSRRVGVVGTRAQHTHTHMCTRTLANTHKCTHTHSHARKNTGKCSYA
jgi:hypothetical protein